MLLKEQDAGYFIKNDSECYQILRVYNDKKQLSLIQVLNHMNQIYKVLFYDESSRLSNMSIYNTDNGKEIKNITFKSDGKSISSVRDYDTYTGRLASVTFYKPQGNNISSVIEYDEFGQEAQFTLFADDGEIITQEF